MKISADSFKCRSKIKTLIDEHENGYSESVHNLDFEKGLVCFVLQKQRIFDYGYLEETHKIVFYPT